MSYLSDGGTQHVAADVYTLHASCVQGRCYWGVQVTCEHVRHNKSGIAHRGSSKVEALTGTPTPGLSHFSAGGREVCLEEQW